MRKRTIDFLEGAGWTALVLANGVILVVRIINDQDYHQASMSGLLCCILAKMAFKAAGGPEGR